MLLRLLRTYLKPYRGFVGLLLAFEVLQITATLFLPNLNGQMVDRGIATGDVGVVWSLGGFMVLLTLGQIIASIIAIVCGAIAAMRAARDLRRDYFTAVQSFGHTEIARFGSTSLTTRATNDIRQVQQFLTVAMSMMVMAPILAVGGLVMAIAQDPPLSWVIVVTVVILAAVMVFLITRMVPSFRQMQERIDSISSVLGQQISGLRVIRAFTKEKVETARFDQSNTALTQTMTTVGNYFVALFPAVMTLVNLGTVAVVWFGAHQVQSGDSEIGTVMAFIQYLLLILMGVVMVSFLSMMVPRAQVSAGRILDVIDTTPVMDRDSGAVSVLPTPGTIQFDDVSYSFPHASHCVVQNVSFTVASGATCAVIGATGAGKSTLVHLLLRLMDPTAGEVAVGGVSLRDLAPQTLAGQFGYVPQRPVVFGGTIRENLRIGSPDASDELMWEALRIAQATEFVAAYDDGLDHVLNQDGTNLSGGQRQRLTIAMALCRQAPILVFDDSFSALDAATDRALRDELARLDSTQFIVTQRVASAMGADLILVVDKGTVVAAGSHEELASTSTVYREILQSQLGPRADDAAMPAAGSLPHHDSEGR